MTAFLNAPVMATLSSIGVEAFKDAGTPGTGIPDETLVGYVCVDDTPSFCHAVEVRRADGTVAVLA